MNMQNFILIFSFVAVICHIDSANLRGHLAQRDFRIGTGGNGARSNQQRFTSASPSYKANQPPKVSRSLKKVNESREDTGMKTLYARPSVPITPRNIAISTTSSTTKTAPVFPPTVDMFFFLDFIGGPKYVRKEYFWMLPKIAFMYSRSHMNGTESDTRIHIVSSSVDVLERSSVLGFYSHDLNYQVKQYAGLLSRVAGTVKNDRQEKKILRWKAYHDIVSEWNTEASESPIRRIIVVEDEVLMTVNAASLFDRSFQAAPSGVQVINLADSVSFFSVAGLASFVSFIDEWYSGSMEDIEARSMDAEKKEWTDALLLDRFISAAPTSSAATRLAWFPPTSSIPVGKDAEQERLVNALGCVPLGNYRLNLAIQFELNGQVVSGLDCPSRVANSSEISVRSVNEKYPYCFLRFQERNNKSLLYAYGRSLEILRQGEEKYTVSARDNLHGDLLLAPEASQEIYHIGSDSVRHFVSSQEVFTSRAFVSDDIIANVPFAVITAFQPSPGPAHPWANGTTVQFIGRSRTVYYVIAGVLHPIASGEVFERLNLKYEDVVKDKTYTGPIFNTLPFGAELQ